VTRIASGCAPADAARIDREWREIDPTGDFRAHFAPPGELRGNYKYSNKPSGLHHWLTTASPPPFFDRDRGVVALLDPDMLLLRPITAALARGLRVEGKALVDAAGVPRVLMGGARELARVPDAVAPGAPLGQESPARGVARAPRPCRRGTP